MQKMQKLTAVSDFENGIWEFENPETNSSLIQEYEMTPLGLTPVEEIKKLKNFYPEDSIKQNEIDSLMKLKQNIEKEIDKKRAIKNEV